MMQLLLAFLWAFICLISPTLAQTNKLFQWQFANNLLSNQLPTCNPLPIIVKSFDPVKNETFGTPPYYLISFALGGTPVTTLIGTDDNNLSWTVTQPVGTQLVLSVVDANGSAGGIAPRVFTVIPGQTTQCVSAPPRPTTPFTVTMNVTSELRTCQPWGFAIKGGVPPYNITLLSTNSAVVTNVTVGLGDDHFTYINRADPDGTLLGAVSDLTGRWASGVTLVNTKGSTNVDCTGLVSSSGKTEVIQRQIADAQRAARRAADQKRSTIIGVTVTLVLLLLIGLGVAGWWFWRKRKMEKRQHHESFLIDPAMPTAYLETKSEPQILSINNYLDSSNGSNGSTTTDSGVMSGTTRPVLTKAQEVARYREEATAAAQHQPSYSQMSWSPPSSVVSSRSGRSRTRSPEPAGGSGQAGGRQSPSRAPSIGSTNSSGLPANPAAGARPGFASFPARSIRGSAKAIEAGYVDDDGAGPSRRYQPQHSRNGSALAGPPGLALRDDDEGVREGEVVIQHRDGGAVRELPPPYANRQSAVSRAA